MKGFGWCQSGAGTSAECDNLAESGTRYCALHQPLRMLAADSSAHPTEAGGVTAWRKSRTPAPISPGVYILEEITSRGWTLNDLRAELTHEYGGCSDSTLLAYLDGSQTVKPICPILARFFGTSVSLWKRMAKQWDERATNGQKTGNESLPVSTRESE